MKTLKAKQLKEMTKEELQQKYRELQKQLFSLKFQTSTQEISNPVQTRLLRKDIARIMTILKDK